MEGSKQLKAIPLIRLDCKYCRLNGNEYEGANTLYPLGSYKYCFLIFANYIEKGGDAEPNNDISTPDGES